MISRRSHPKSRRTTAILLAAALLGATAGAQELTRPRIFTTPQDLPRLREMASDDRPNALGIAPAEAWRAILDQADRFLAAKPYTRSTRIPLRSGGHSEMWTYTLSESAPPPHDANPSYPLWTSMFQERTDSITTRIRFLMTAWLVTQKGEYFERAKEIVLKLCQWETKWTDPQYGGGKACLDTGHAAVWVGILYDWGYEALSEAERQTIRTALAEKALQPAHEDIDRLPTYHNINMVLASGLGVGALALMGEDDRAEQWLDHAMARMSAYMDEQGKDGGPMEGPLYGTYAGAALSDMVWALDTAGRPNELARHSYLQTIARYCIALANPNDYTVPTFGDGRAQRVLPRTMRVLALRGDRAAAWYCIQTGSLEPDTPRGFLALDPHKIQPEEPQGLPSDCFIDIGYASLREGFRPGSNYLAFKAGPPEKLIHHNHYDHNSFQINASGYWVAGDPGYRARYNPAREKYTLSTLGHNSIVLDLGKEYLETLEHFVVGHDQVRKTGARIAAFCTGETFDYVMGSAAETYNPEDSDVKILERFDRQIVFAKPDLFFVCDRIQAPAPHTYSFLLHAESGGEIETAPATQSGATYSGPGVLRAHVYADTGPIQVHAATLPGAESYGPYMAATTANRTKRVRLNAVLAPGIVEGRLIGNPGFEGAIAPWRPRSAQGCRPNHTIDTDVKHGGQSSGRIDKNGYFYSSNFKAPTGAWVHASFWARLSAPDAVGASSCFYFWKAGKQLVGSAPGPAAQSTDWQRYEFSAQVPDGTLEVTLALIYAGQATVWYDDAEVRIGGAQSEGDPLPNGGFENGMEPWRPRGKPGFLENHVIDTEVAHSGKASARIDGPGGYYYSPYFAAAAGSKVTATFWAKADCESGATSLFFQWKDDKAFHRTPGPAASGNEWRHYSFSTEVLENTEKVSLALQFFGEGKVWYDDVSIEIEAPPVPGLPQATPEPVVTPIGDGSEGIVCQVGATTYVMLSGQSGSLRTCEALGHRFQTDAELAVVKMAPEGRSAFYIGGRKLEVDGRALQCIPATWRVGAP